jgi:3-hydroxyisobutyrate dehydrogenase-like beta-hydroxyacid dehydrogenase
MAYTVALIGIGAMGQALLARLVGAGHTVQGYDVSPKSRATAEQLGATLKTSASDAACGARYVHVFVNSDEQMLEATVSPHGAIAGMSSDATLILHSTVLPQTSREISVEAARHGIRTIDSPITSVPQRVRDGHAAFLVGCDSDLIEGIRDYLESLGGHVYYFGGLGSGNAAKLAKNFANAAGRILLAEAVQMAEAGGIEPQAFLDMMVSEEHGSMVGQWRKMFAVDTGHAIPKPAPNLFNKDVLLAAEFAKASGLETPMAQGAARTALTWIERWGMKSEVPRPRK